MCSLDVELSNEKLVLDNVAQTIFLVFLHNASVEIEKRSLLGTSRPP